MSTALYTANEFILLSLPRNAAPANSPNSNADLWLQKELLDGKTFVSDFHIPELKISSLDSLIVQSEDLAKADTQIGSSIGKIVEILTNLNEAGSNAYKTVPINNVPVPEYLENFHWMTRKFRLDKSVGELTKMIEDDAMQLDSDVRATSANYNNAKNDLVTAERKKTGDLSVRSLHDIVKPEDFILHSEHLTTVLVAVPKNLKSRFEKSYESLAKYVIPGSAGIIAQDDEYILYNVHLFKKSVQDFNAACREKKFVPREFNYSEELIDKLKREHDSAAHLEQSLRSQLVRLAKAAYSDSFIDWFHIKALRVFVESVLRYGLPPDFSAKVIAVPPRNLTKCKAELTEAFGYLSGNAFAKNKQGKIVKEDAALHQYAALVDTEYEPFVIYTVTL